MTRTKHKRKSYNKPKKAVEQPVPDDVFVALGCENIVAWRNPVPPIEEKADWRARAREPIQPLAPYFVSTDPTDDGAGQ